MRSVSPTPTVNIPHLAQRAGRLFGPQPALFETKEDASGDAERALTFLDLADAADAFALRALKCGLAQGERILIFGAARASVIIAILGSVAANLELTIAPAHLSAERLSVLAKSTNAAALFGPLAYGGLNLREIFLETVVLTPAIRFIGSLGPGLCENMVDFSYPLYFPHRREAPPDVNSCHTRIGLLTEPTGSQMKMVFFKQEQLVEYAVQAGMLLNVESEDILVSTVSPASLPGLAIGLVLSLVSGACLTLCAPFQAESFLRYLNGRERRHLIAPEQAAPELEKAGLGSVSRLASLTLTRHNDFPLRGIFKNIVCPLILASQQEDGALILIKK